MAEIDAFERRVAETLRWYGDDVTPVVDAMAVAHRVAVEHPRGRVIGRAPLASLAWLGHPLPVPGWIVLLVGLLLAALLGSALLGGARWGERSSIVPPSSPSPSTAADKATNVLATTRAHALPPAATCPRGSNPDAVGAAEQTRPPVETVGLDHPIAFDRRAGRLVLLASGADPTWTFDVCSNTWHDMGPSSEPAGAGSGLGAWLAYDADSDRTVALVRERADGFVQTWEYNLAANRWTRRSNAPVSRIGTGGYGLVYHDRSGLIVLYDGTGMWTYDVDADSWTTVRQRPDPARPGGAGLPAGFMALGYDPLEDLLVAFADPPPGPQPTETWAFDPVTGTWRREPGATTPELKYGWFSSGSGTAFDEARGKLVFAAGDGSLEGYDARRDVWTTLLDAKSEIRTGAAGGCSRDTPVYDPLNARIVCRVRGDGMAAITVAGQWRFLVEPVAAPSPAP
jgi:hypothetical protein